MLDMLAAIAGKDHADRRRRQPQGIERAALKRVWHRSRAGDGQRGPRKADEGKEPSPVPKMMVPRPCWLSGGTIRTIFRDRLPEMCRPIGISALSARTALESTDVAARLRAGGTMRSTTTSVPSVTHAPQKQRRTTTGLRGKGRIGDILKSFVAGRRRIAPEGWPGRPHSVLKASRKTS